MSEAGPATADDLTAEQAVETIQRAQTYEEPLRRRTEGVTWMIWGLVTVGISLGFASIQEFFGSTGAPWWYYPLNLFGWVLAGGVFTYALWRIAALGTPSLRPRGRRSALAGLLWLPLVYAAWGLVLLVGPGLHETVIIPASIGITWTFLGGVNAFKATPTGRRVLLAAGLLILVGAAAFAYATAGQPERIRWTAHTAFLIVVAGGAPFVGGLWQSLRG